jgi:hypothetical protein
LQFLLFDFFCTIEYTKGGVMWLMSSLQAPTFVAAVVVVVAVSWLAP